MKIDFIIFLILDALLLIYLVAAIVGILPAVVEYAKMAFAAICILVPASSRILTTMQKTKNSIND